MPLPAIIPPPPQNASDVNDTEWRFWFFLLQQTLRDVQLVIDNIINGGGSSGIPLIRNYISVTDPKYKVTGNGVNDDTSAFETALADAAGNTLLVPSPGVAYKITRTLVIPENTVILGESKEGTRILLGAAVPLFTFSQNGVGLFNLFLDGGSFAGNAITVTGTSMQQTVQNCRMTDFNDDCISFERSALVGVDQSAAGEGFVCDGCLIYPVPASGFFAVRIADFTQAAACPRKFSNLETGGEPSFAFGGSNSTYVSNCFLDDITYSTNTRAVFIGQSRIAGLNTININGGQSTIVGCDTYPLMTIASGTSGNVIGPNAYNSAGTTAIPVDDNSGNGQNLVYHYDYAYTPTFSASGGGTALGNGTIVGTMCRQGHRVSINIQFTIGATTNLGAGIFRFSIPPEAPTSFAFPQFEGQCRGTSGGLLYFGTPALANGTAYVELQRDTVNGFTFNTPVVWAAGDVINVSFTYSV